MIPKIHAADKISEDLWLVYYWVDDEPRFPLTAMVPVGEPKQCLGGAWCEQFGCTPGDNVFTRAETELLIEEGTEIPDGFDINYILEHQDELAEVFEQYGEMD